MAVRLDIRPRLRLSEPRAAARRGFRLPALALPAAGYWVFMAALTYVFAHLGPHPLEALASEPAGPQHSKHPQPLSPALPSEPPLAPEPVSELGAPAEDTNREALAPPPIAPASPDHDGEPQAEPKDERKQRRIESAVASDARDTEPEVAKAPPAPVSAPVASFAEFTDTSRPAARSRAADGPRIDSLFEPAREQPLPPPPDDASPERRPDAPIAVTSCEAAIARNNEQLTIGGPRRPADITREAYAGILQNGRYLASCPLPDRTVIEICAAVRDGRAVGVTVVSNPPRATLDACVRSAVARLTFPKNDRLDVTHTRFDAVAR